MLPRRNVKIGITIVKFGQTVVFIFDWSHMITICISVLIYDVVNRTRGVRNELSGSERDANKVELATAHRTKSRADVLLIKIPPAPPSRNGGHVLYRTFRFTLSCTRLTFYDNGDGVSTPCMKRNSFATLYKIRACVEDWQHASASIECGMYGLVGMRERVAQVSPILKMFSQNWPGALYCSGRNSKPSDCNVDEWKSISQYVSWWKREWDVSIY